ncbi:MAG: DmsE family decaheme c-type cytochrome [Acidobacteriota bacterium]|jgi:DmsE family decaheme c-type cytochrome|nr:MAG: cytochrome C [Acidobacteriota bacterium]
MARVLASVRFAIPLILLATVGLRSEPSAVGQSASPDPAGEAAVVQAQAPLPDATYVGESRCIECHAQENRHYSETTHAKVFRQNPAFRLQQFGCEACHGPGSRHVANALDRTAIIGFTKGWGTEVPVQNSMCQNCHGGGTRMHWPGSAHASNDVGCADCHNPMQRVSTANLLVRPTIAETCFQCHPQQRAEFQRRSHMPVPEGRMTCTDCHNPHGSVTRPLLRADSVNDVCYSCHAEKRGPFLWEHAPVRESCLNCHQPHGSNHDKLLVSARPYICQQCHNPPIGHPGQFYRDGQTAAGALMGVGQSARVIGRSCQNCHTQIHGSNHPAGARFQR